ncbi:MAG TPA: ATP-dependent 6-phosphofructokinase [bacterium]|nr:ATP-dependent 6-phosphofructokinase [bacterium]
MRIGILTGGGDCSGLNAAIRAVVRAADKDGHRVYGILSGWKGLLKGEGRWLRVEETAGLLSLGGTILGSSRVNPLKVRGGLKLCLRNFRKAKLNALIVVGGEGTLKIADALSRAGLPLVVIPKTIDNDTAGTDATIGFDTAVQVATDAIDRLHTTAESHDRVMIVEVMGRHAGWIATYAGLAGGADAILIPEEIFEFKDLMGILKKRAKRGRHYSIFVVSEDARIRLASGKILRTPLQHDEYGDVKLGGIGEMLAKEIRKSTGAEVRVTVLGHVQRGGTPTAGDRVLATRLGIAAVHFVEKRQFGRMAVAHGAEIVSIPISESAGQTKRVPPRIAKLGRVFFG